MTPEEESLFVAIQLKELYDRYYSYFLNFLRTNNAFNRNISFPLLIQPFPDYYRSKVKLMIVGQETYSWSISPNVKVIKDEQLHIDKVDSLLRLYRNFGLGKNSPSPFWQFNHKLNGKFNKSGQAFIWNNINKVDENRGSPKWDLFKGACSLDGHNIIHSEIEILNPNIVVFVTGRKLDGHLRFIFKGHNMKPLNEYMSRIEHPLLPYHSYKTEHPLVLRIRGKFDKAIEFISSEVKINGL